MSVSPIAAYVPNITTSKETNVCISVLSKRDPQDLDHQQRDKKMRW